MYIGFECFGKGSDDAIVNSILDRSITGEYTNNTVTSIQTIALGYCNNLTTVNLNSVKILGTGAFNNCKKLENVNIPNLQTCGMSSFAYCYALTKLDFCCVKQIAPNCFQQCTSLNILIIRTNSVCSLGNLNAFTDTPISAGTGYIYVPNALLEDYKTATNWVTYSDQFRAIEDYPDICGDNGND